MRTDITDITLCCIIKCARRFLFLLFSYNCYKFTMESKKKMRVTQDHWKIVVDFGEQHPEIITNKFSDHSQRKITQKRIWEELVIKLNSLGQGFRSVDEWKKTLADWKSKTKKKAAQNNKDIFQTEGGSSSGVPLTTLEDRFLSLMGKTAIYGDNSASEKGLKRPLHEMTEISNENVEEEEVIFDDNVEVVCVEDHLYAMTSPPSETVTSGGSSTLGPSQKNKQSVNQARINKLPQKNKKNMEEMHEEITCRLTNIIDVLSSLDSSIKSIALSLSIIAKNTKK